MLLSAVSATAAIRAVKLKCLGLVVIKHPNHLILPFLISFFPEIVRIFKNVTVLFWHVPDFGYILLLLMKTSQHKFIHAESRWFHLSSHCGHGCGVEKCKDSACKRGNRNGRGLHSSADGGRGEIFPRTGLLLINGALKIARILSF